MELSATIPFSIFLLAGAAVLMNLHVRAWRQAKLQQLEAAELQYRWRQFRRRMQTSGMLGALAVAIFFGPWITRPPLLVVCFWLGVFLLLVWVALLALVDVAATRLHFARLRDDNTIEQAKLRAEISRIESLRGNGKGQSQP